MSVRGAYGVAATLAVPVLRWWLARRVRAGKEIAARLPERWGVEATARPPGTLLWLHAASVGESVSVLPVLVALAAARPDVVVLMTTGTVTSAALLARRLPELGLDKRVLHRFVPLDVPRWVGRFLDHWRPDGAAFVESEIWPNLLTGCARRGVPVALVNGRMSAPSFASWRRLGRVARSVFAEFAWVQAQSAGDAARLRALGAPAGGVVGNLKFAAAPLPVDAAELARLRGLLAGRPMWLAASTHPGEEFSVFAVHGRLVAEFPGLLTIIVPRHPERGATIAAACGGTVTRRGAGEDPPAGAGVWVADTLGELGLFYRLAGFAFVGRSLGASVGGAGGGQNPLEPARLGCAVAVGPEVANFADIVAVLREAGALAQVADATGLAEWVAEMLRDPGRRAAMGAAGRAAASDQAALPGRVAGMLADLVR